MLNLRPPLDPFAAAFGLAATVTPAGGGPVSTSVIWVQTQVEGDSVGGGRVSDLQWRLRVRRDEVPSLPPTSTIVCPPPAGGAPQPWTVERVDSRDPDYFSAQVAG
jgi:hypothetical protein